MQHPHPVPLRRRPRRISRKALVLLRRRLPKRRSLFQLLTRGRGIRSSNREQEVVGGGDGKEEMEMEVVNMKLFWENRWIMEENQRLRKRALALRHENQILLTQLHHHHHDPKFFDTSSSTILTATALRTPATTSPPPTDSYLHINISASISIMATPATHGSSS